MMCLGLGLFAFILCGTLCASWTYMSISFTKWGKFSFTSFSNRIPISCSCSSSFGIAMAQMLEPLKLSQRLLTLSSFFWIFFSSSCSDSGFLLPYVPNHFHSWLHALYCCLPENCSLFQLIYPSFLTRSFFMLLRSSFRSLSILITSVLISASDRLSPFCLALFLEFSSVPTFGPCFFVSLFWQPPVVVFMY